jgi:hypothetical protein
MSLPYVSPAKMSEYRQRITLFTRGADSLECIRSHYFPERTGVCDLTSAPEQEEIYVLANRMGATLKVSKGALQIVANIVEIKNLDEWYEKLKIQKKSDKEKKLQSEKLKESQRAAPKAMVFKRRPIELIEKNKIS